MLRIVSVAGVAAVTLFTIFGAAHAASTENLPVDQILVTPLNEAQVTTVPAPDAVEPAPPEELVPPTPRTLAEMVAAQAMPATLDKQTECLAASVYFEARSEPLDGQLAVAEVVLNRAGSGRFPSSICAVVFQPSQFSFVRGKGFPPINRVGSQWKRAVAIAQIAMSDAWDSKASNALYFHATRVSPNWRKTRVATLGNHVFYR